MRTGGFWPSSKASLQLVSLQGADIQGLADSSFRIAWRPLPADAPRKAAGGESRDSSALKELEDRLTIRHESLFKQTGWSARVAWADVQLDRLMAAYFLAALKKMGVDVRPVE
jgi:hypothetical protein